MKSEKIAVIAVLFWLASLALPGIHLYRGSYVGLLILLLGWMSGNYAWFANLFFGYAFFRIVSSAKSVPYVAIFIAGILSLDTFRAGEFLVDEGGGTSAVFGYGYGALLWFISLCLMWIATAQRSIEISISCNNDHLGASKAFRGAGVGLLLVVLGGSFVFAVADRIGATPAESERLSSAVFKRGSVCKTASYQPLSPPQPIHGILSIAGSVKRQSYVFWDSPLDFLKWGAPVVRVGATEYFFLDPDAGGRVVARPASSEKSPTLSVSELSHEVRADFSSPDHPGTLFSYVWKTRDDGVACPEWSISNTPRQIILSSLALSEKSTPQSSKPNVRPAEADVYRLIPEITSFQKYDGSPVSPVMCSADVELLENFQKEHPESERLGLALQVKDTIHFFPELGFWHGRAICSGNATYLVNITEGMKDDGIHIRKVPNHDPSLLWHIHAPLPRDLLMKSVLTVKESGGFLIVVLERNPRREGVSATEVVVLRIPLEAMQSVGS